MRPMTKCCSNKVFALFLVGAMTGLSKSPTAAERCVTFDEHSLDELTHAKRVLEGVLLASHEPVPLDEIIQVFDPPVPTETVSVLLLADLTAEWKERGSIELVQVASGYRFQTRTEMRIHIDRLTPEPAASIRVRCWKRSPSSPTGNRHARRGGAIRGVAVSTNILKALEDRGWIEVIGHKDTPGRPALYATTKSFQRSFVRSLSNCHRWRNSMRTWLSSCRRYRRAGVPEQGRIDDVNESDDLPGTGGAGHAASSAGRRRRGAVRNFRWRCHDPARFADGPLI